MGDLWRATHRTLRQVTRLLQRALQNERGNQCLPARARGPGSPTIGDINERGYEAGAAPGAQCPRIAARRSCRRLPARSPGSKGCGRVRCDGPLARGAEDGSCVPRGTRGRRRRAAPQPDRHAATEADRRRLQRRAHAPPLRPRPRPGRRRRAARHSRTMRCAARREAVAQAEPHVRPS